VTGDFLCEFIQPAGSPPEQKRQYLFWQHHFPVSQAQNARFRAFTTALLTVLVNFASTNFTGTIRKALKATNI